MKPEAVQHQKHNDVAEKGRSDAQNAAHAAAGRMFMDAHPHPVHTERVNKPATPIYQSEKFGPPGRPVYDGGKFTGAGSDASRQGQSHNTAEKHVPHAAVHHDHIDFGAASGNKNAAGDQIRRMHAGVTAE